MEVLKHIASIFLLTLLACISSSSVSRAGEADSLENLLKIAKQDTNRVKILITILNIKGCDTAGYLAYVQQAKDLSIKLKWRKGELKANMSMAEWYFCRKEDEKAIAICLQSASIAHNERIFEEEGDQYRRIAQIYERRTRYKEALSYHEKALGIYRKARSLNVLNTLGDIGNIYAQSDNIPMAIDYYKAALDFGSRNYKKNTDYLYVQAITLLNIGDLYVDIERYDEALKNYDSLLRINKTLNDELLEATANVCIADMLVKTGHQDDAIGKYKRTIGILSGTNEGSLLPSSYLGLVDIYLDKGDISLAEKYIAEADKIINGHNIARLKPYFDVSMGRLYGIRKQYPDAVRSLTNAIQLSKGSDNISLETAAWRELYKVYEHSGQQVKAYDAYKHYIAVKDSMENRQDRKAVYLKEMQSDFDKRKIADSVKYAQEKQVAGLQLQKQRAYTIGGFVGLSLLLLVVFFVFRNYRQQKNANLLISREKHRSEELLLNILPLEVADELKKKGSVTAKSFEKVTVLFTDFVNFTTAGEKLTPQELVNELHTCFKAFDEIIERHQIEKIKTVGDAYLAVSGLPVPDDSHAENMVHAAIAIRDFMLQRKRSNPNAFEVRIGIHSGNIVAGIVGIKKFAYDIWGDTVNTAARMEQNSESGKINISEATYELVKEKFHCTYRGELEAKNKGRLKMYFIQ